MEDGAKRSLARERGGSARINYLQGPPEVLVRPVLMGPVCLISQGQFEEPAPPM